MQGTIHIIGAGLAGLSAATSLAAAGRRVAVYEASTQAGGRCRSYHDAALDMVIDNGNHLLLSGNESARAYLRRIGSEEIFAGAKRADYDFVDARTLKCWTLSISNGRFPFWLFEKNRRVPETAVSDYFSILKLLWAKPHETITPLLDSGTLLYQRLWHPLLLSALNTSLGEASAQLAGAILRGTLLKGGDACVPLVAEGLSAVFIDPALRYITGRDGSIAFGRRVQRIAFEDGAATALEFSGGERVAVKDGDGVICAAPAWTAGSLLPEIRMPDAYRSILNAHYRIAPPPGFPPLVGVVNATTEWLFAFGNRLSVTVSDADRLMQEDRDSLARRIWGEVSAITGLASDLPPWQIVKEKRATFAATPEQEMKRPEARTRWRNVHLAGDYTRTGLPSTIEGAVLSGAKAAEHILA